MSNNPNPDPLVRDEVDTIDDPFGVNLRELIARLQCFGMPEFSECGVMARLTVDGKIFDLKAIRYDHESDTVWLELEEF